MILLGLSGKKQSGKDTCAEMIRDHLHESKKHLYVRLAFADALYEEVAIMLIRQDTNRHLWCEALVKERVRHIKANKADYRLLLQWWGTDYRRKADPDYWIKRWLEKFRALPDNSFVVVPDVRFTNEAECIKKMNGLLGRVERNYTKEVDQHPSECELDGYREWDYFLHNYTTLEALKSHMTSLTKQITTKYK